MANEKKQLKTGTSSDLAALLNITVRRVQQLANDGILTREAEGGFNLPDAIAEYYKYKYLPDDEVDYMEEKAKHEAAKRALAELELAKRRNEVHDAADVEAVMTDMLSNLRGQLSALPTKMASVLADRSADYISAALSEEIEARLSELSDYNPAMFSDYGVSDETTDD